MTTQPEGSIRQRKDGRWEGRIIVGGQRLSRYGTTRAEVEQKLRDLQVGLVSSQPLISLKEWTTRWLNERDLRPSALSTYQRTLAPVLDDLGHVILTKLNPPMLALQFSMLRQRGMGSRRLQLAHGYLRAILDQAVEDEHLAHNPMAKLKAPKWAPRTHCYWTESQTQAFISTCLESGRRYAPLFVLMACTGLRISEALGIESGDVDRERGTITVSRAWVFTPGRGYSLELPKTTSSRRVIAVPSIAVPALERVPIRTRTGKLPGPGDLRTYLAALCALAGVPKLSPHGLRHVHAALAYHVTGDVYAVQKRMGHAQVSTTMNIYGFGMGADGAVRDGLDTLFQTVVPDPPAHPDTECPRDQITQ